jgi:hypothetical protein
LVNQTFTILLLWLNVVYKQTAEVARRQARVREVPGNPENAMRLQAAEAKMQELKANMAVLGKEAAAAMAAVESQQQRLTLQRLIAMVYLSIQYNFCFPAFRKFTLVLINMLIKWLYFLG